MYLVIELLFESILYNILNTSSTTLPLSSIHRRRPGAELFLEVGKELAHQNFSMTCFGKKFPFLLLKFLIPFQICLSLPCQMFYMMTYMYMDLSSREEPLFRNKIFHDAFHDAFFHSVRTFARVRQHYFSKYWGMDAWAVPSPQIWGDCPSQ